MEKCKFGAVSLNEYGVAEIEEEKCIGCGACGKVCPQKIIHVHECANWIVVKCSNKSKGARQKNSVKSVVSAVESVRRPVRPGQSRLQITVQ